MNDLSNMAQVMADVVAEEQRKEDARFNGELTRWKDGIPAYQQYQNDNYYAGRPVLPYAAPPVHKIVFWNDDAHKLDERNDDKPVAPYVFVKPPDPPKPSVTVAATDGVPPSQLDRIEASNKRIEAMLVALLKK